MIVHNQYRTNHETRALEGYSDAIEFTSTKRTRDAYMNDSTVYVATAQKRLTVNPVLYTSPTALFVKRSKQLIS